MARHYFGWQYEHAYKPTALCNWEVPKFYCDRARTRTGKTQIISNSRGHILPGVPRPPCNPFGNFIGTWFLPKKIDRATADHLNGLADRKMKLIKCRRAALGLHQKEQDEQEGINVEKQVGVELQPERLKDNSLEEYTKRKLSVPDEEDPHIERIICPIHDF